MTVVKNELEIGFLFDLDGVLIDSSEFHYQAWKLLEEEVADFETDHDEFLQTFGMRNHEILMEKIPGLDFDEVEILSERKEELFRDCCRGKIELLPGVENFLKELDFHQAKKIIASSTPESNLRFFLKETILGKYFDSYVAGDQVDKGKPAPDIFLKAAKKLELSPKNCLVFEDSPAGLKAGYDAGAFVVALATTHPPEHLENYHLLLSGPEKLSLDDLLSYDIDQLKNSPLIAK